jgi:16S rRNA (guanine527-N7)-methyltransferase
VDQDPTDAADSPVNDPAPASSVEPKPDHPNLAAALAAHQIELEPAQIELLDRYRVALWRWNEQINLTRHTTFEKFVARDVLDSLELAKQLPQGRRVLDLGSGGGVPGIIIAICRPDLRVTLCDSVGKKAKVLQALVDELGLPTEVFGVRVEELLDLRTFDVIVARAVAPMWKILFWLDAHWQAFDELLLIKGHSWVDERGEARHRGLLKKIDLRKIVDYVMPGDPPGQSVILRLTPKASGDHDE